MRHDTTCSCNFSRNCETRLNIPLVISHTLPHTALSAPPPPPLFTCSRSTGHRFPDIDIDQHHHLFTYLHCDDTFRKNWIDVLIAVTAQVETPIAIAAAAAAAAGTAVAVAAVPPPRRCDPVDTEEHPVYTARLACDCDFASSSIESILSLVPLEHYFPACLRIPNIIVGLSSRSRLSRNPSQAARKSSVG